MKAEQFGLDRIFALSASPVVSHTVTHSFPLEQAILAANAVLPHLAKSDVNPAITGAKVTHDLWFAVDRDSAARFQISRPYDGPLAIEKTTDESVLIGPEAVQWIAKIDVKKLRNYRLRGLVGEEYALAITRDSHEPNFQGGRVPDDVTVAITFDGKVERSQSFDPLDGNFPNLEMIFDRWKPAATASDQAIMPAQLEKVTTFARKHYKNDALLMSLGDSRKAGIPGKVKASVGALTALIQPNLILRRSAPQGQDK